LKTHKDWVAAAIILLLSIAYFSPYLFSNQPVLIYPKSNLGTDLTREVWPNADYLAQIFHQSGAIALWRTFLLSGSPMAGHPVIPMGYPPYWLILVLPVARALNILAAFHIAWMGAGAYFFLKEHFNLPLIPSLVGALIFSQSPKWIAHLSGGHWPMLYAIAWWPWAWLGITRYFQTKKPAWVLLSGWSIGFMASTDLRILYLCLCCLGIWSLFTFQKPIGGWFKRMASSWVAIAGLALLVSAPQIVPFIELLRISNRTILPISEASFGNLPPALLLGIFFPSDFQFPEWFIYPGIGAIIFASVGWAKGWSVRERGWAWAGLLGAILALGTFTPIYPLFYKLVPGFSMLRVPARWWILVLFSLSILAALGVEKWLNRQPWIGKRFQFVILGLGGVIISAAIFRQVRPAMFPYEARFTALFFLGLISILLLGPRKITLLFATGIILAGQWSASLPLIKPFPVTSISQDDPVSQFLLNAAEKGQRSYAPYSGLPFQKWVNPNLKTADGYDSFQLDGYRQLVQAASGCDYQGYAVSAPATQSDPKAQLACPDPNPDLDLLRVVNVHYLVLPADKSMPDLTPVIETNTEKVYKLQPGLGELWIANNVVTTPSQTCIETLTRTKIDETVLVEHEIDIINPGFAEILTWTSTPNSARVQVQADQPSLLVRSEAWAPGWKVNIDGERTELLRVDCALQGVIVPAGNHQIEFIYEPLGWKLGWIGMAVILALSVIILSKTNFRGENEKVLETHLK